MHLASTLLQKSYFIALCRFYYQRKKLFIYPLLLIGVVFIHWELVYPFFPSFGLRWLAVYLGELGASFAIQLISASLFYQLYYATIGSSVMKKQLYQVFLLAMINAGLSTCIDYGPISNFVSVPLYVLWKMLVLLVVLFLVIEKIPLKQAFKQAALALILTPKVLVRLALEGIVGFSVMVTTIFSILFLIDRFLQMSDLPFIFLYTILLIFFISLAYLFFCKGLLIIFEQYKSIKNHSI